MPNWGARNGQVVAKSGSAKKALEDMRDRNRTDTERKERKERKATMRNKESAGTSGDIRNVLGCQVDVQASKRIRELEDREQAYWKRSANADPAEYKELWRSA